MEHDDDTNPPPCPWCGKPEVHELGASDAEVRSFNCRSCSRSFVVSITPLNPAAPKRES